jgi:hypothetical protein
VVTGTNDHIYNRHTKFYRIPSSNSGDKTSLYLLVVKCESMVYQFSDYYDR